MNNGISIEKWIELCRDGSKIPVKTYLDGNSMKPLIRKGKDLITIMPIDEIPPVDSIVLFKNINGGYTVHRLYRVFDNGVQTRGDNCAYPDPIIPEKNILGIVHSMKKNGRTVLLDCDKQRCYAKVWNKYFRKKYLKYMLLRNKFHYIRKKIGFFKQHG